MGYSFTISTSIDVPSGVAVMGALQHECGSYQTINAPSAVVTPNSSGHVVSANASILPLPAIAIMVGARAKTITKIKADAMSVTAGSTQVNEFADRIVVPNSAELIAGTTKPVYPHALVVASTKGINLERQNALILGGWFEYPGAHTKWTRILPREVN